MATDFGWREPFSSAEVNLLHAEAFGPEANGRDWRHLAVEHSLGWVTARNPIGLIGFINVVWDGADHAWLQDVMVSALLRGGGVGTAMVNIAKEEAGRAGCGWLHVDFDEDLAAFYLGACGFTRTSAGLIQLHHATTKR
jgi:GNAT superfamily N-acetyltransferase